MAKETSRPLHDLLGWPGPVTNRQYLAWQGHRSEGWNLPDRTDHYLMQIACEVRRVLSKDPASITNDQFKIGFEKRKHLTRKEKRAAKKAQRELNMAKWKALAGYKEPKKA